MMLVYSKRYNTFAGLENDETDRFVIPLSEEKIMMASKYNLHVWDLQTHKEIWSRWVGVHSYKSLAYLPHENAIALAIQDKIYFLNMNSDTVISISSTISDIHNITVCSADRDLLLQMVNHICIAMWVFLING